MSYQHLFSKGQIGSLVLKNRVVLPPLEVGMANYDGTPSDQLIRYYLERAKNDIGLIITGITRVNELHGASLPRQLSMSDDRHIDPFARMVDEIHEQGTKIFCQLHHPGRQNLSMMIGFWPVMQCIGRVWPGFWTIFPKLVPGADWLMHNVWAPSVVAPSPIPCRHCNQKTRALTLSEIKALIQDFTQAAMRVKLSGADGVELHAAHGYLIQQFLSPRTNKRTDEYGGTPQKRMQFLLELIENIKQVCGKDFPLVVRLAVDEFYWAIGEEDQGIVLEEGIRIAKAIENAGVDAIDVTSATYETMNYWLEPASFTPGWRKNLAGAVKANVKVPVIAANLIRSPQQAEEQLQEGFQDFVALGRQLLADPEWLVKAKEGREKEIVRCICCLYCIESLNKNAALGLPLECTVNPRLGHERTSGYYRKNGKGRTVAIIGAGPAGLTAAAVLGQRDFKPLVFEKNDFVGGQLQLANKPPKKEKINWCFQDLWLQALKHGTDIHFNTTPSIADLQKLNPYAIIVATGGKPILPNIKGIDHPHVCPFTDVLNGSVQINNQKVAVIGSGMTGLETSEKLAEQGNQLLIVEMMDNIGPGAYHQNMTDVMSRLITSHPEFLTGYKLVEICDKHIVLENTHTGKHETHQVDRVVLSVGMTANDDIQSVLENYFENVYVIGDARKVGRIATATRDGFDVGFAI
ncbi:MAG: FAD-dependent oxidoreductase [Candidatus Magnetomorum sp.]|nr:FAD-dependent oxidoreductase [Candidatus Magnetomorum sp.]